MFPSKECTDADRPGAYNIYARVQLGGICGGFALYFYAMLPDRPRQIIRYAQYNENTHERLQ